MPAAPNNMNYIFVIVVDILCWQCFGNLPEGERFVEKRTGSDNVYTEDCNGRNNGHGNKI